MGQEGAVAVEERRRREGSERVVVAVVFLEFLSVPLSSTTCLGFFLKTVPSPPYIVLVRPRRYVLLTFPFSVPLPFCLRTITHKARKRNQRTAVSSLSFFEGAGKGGRKGRRETRRIRTKNATSSILTAASSANDGSSTLYRDPPSRLS